MGKMHTGLLVATLLVSTLTLIGLLALKFGIDKKIEEVKANPLSLLTGGL